MNAERESYRKSLVTNSANNKLSETNAGCVCKSCKNGNENNSPISWPIAKNSNPPQSFLNWRIVAGCANCPGNSKSVSPSLFSESKRQIGLPILKAFIACDTASSMPTRHGPTS